MSVLALYARRVLKRPFVLLVAIVMPLVLVQGVVLQYHNGTNPSVAVSVTDPVLRGFVTTELKSADIDYSVVSRADRGSTDDAMLAIDGSLEAAAGDAAALRAKVSYGQVSANNVLLATRLNSIASTLGYLADNSDSAAQLRNSLRTFAHTAPAMRAEASVIGNDNATVLVSSFNMIVFVMLLLTMSNILMFVKDKTFTTTQRILIASSSRLGYVAQLVSLFALLAVGEFLVMVAGMRWIFHVPLGLSTGRLAALVGAFVLFNVFAIAFGLLLVTRTTKESVARLLVTAVTLPMAMLGGALWPLSIMPDWMQAVAQVLPTTWVTQLNGALFSGFTPGAWSVARPLLLLAAAGAVALVTLSRVSTEKL
ncbi:ABC transporter permease [Flexivirga oryzae]|uniref:ABC-type multidrug transport system permease subunit n=1 Tax=Flexivirga oryzae TaxID=1794944 RepID=A0A839NAK4_9MICO|nr:ABC transporter permease [Flexivirga oryzae]MBB2893243.1 ABC-type multidrug transport system permease subunit [Flexivirga oryzae]